MLILMKGSYMNELNKLLEKSLKSYDFKYKKSSWYRDRGDFIQLINFQRSNYRNLYYVNLAMDLKISSDIQIKPEYKCPFRLRADSLDNSCRLAKYLNFQDETISSEERINMLIVFLKSWVLFLDSIDTVEKLKIKYQQKEPIFQEALIMSDLLEKLYES